MEAFTTPARDEHQPLETVKVRLESWKRGVGASDEHAQRQQIALVLSVRGNLCPVPRSLTLEDVLLRGGWFQVFEEVVRLLHAVILQVEDNLNYSKILCFLEQRAPPETSMDATMENHDYGAIL